MARGPTLHCGFLSRKLAPPRSRFFQELNFDGRKFSGWYLYIPHLGTLGHKPGWQEVTGDMLMFSQISVADHSRNPDDNESQDNGNMIH